MSRSKRYKADAKRRDGSTFAAVPYVVLESQGYINLSAYARALLLEFCREFNGRNNGRLCCIWDQLRLRGWNSPNTVTKAKAELIANGLLWESRKGAFPNRTAWYALTWRDPGRHRRSGRVTVSLPAACLSNRRADRKKEEIRWPKEGRCAYYTACS